VLHYIIVKYNQTVKNRQETNREIEELFRGIVNIPGIMHVDVCPCVVDRPNRYDLMIEIEMDADALPAYDASDIHKKWKEKYSGMLESKTIFDRKS
jgi:hypothetical protein